ncbi:hypothetical protein Cgig2_023068 [Carnegiea gigantea]|uniref:Uncharacterized protein n=1 Tax=Carnegiea gigantea TaxID=171969 RepID=A0A9Q1GXK2_9CARY|nr:hypothetical protein Cgig2_023068 [Carnegiea gigantea]
MWVTEHDAHMTLGLLKVCHEVVEPKNESNIKFCNVHRVYMCLWELKRRSQLPKTEHAVPNIDRWTNDEIKHRVGDEFVIRFGRRYLKDILDKTTATDEEEEVNQEERRSKNVDDKAKAEDQTRVSKVKATLPQGVALVDSELDIPTAEVQVLNCDVEDVLTRCIMSSQHTIVARYSFS